MITTVSSTQKTLIKPNVYSNNSLDLKLKQIQRANINFKSAPKDLLEIENLGRSTQLFGGGAGVVAPVIAIIKGAADAIQGNLAASGNTEQFAALGLCTLAGWGLFLLGKYGRR